MKYTVYLIAFTLLTGCMDKSTTVVDNSPKNPTAVIKSKGSINGFVLPDSTFKEVVYTRKNKQTIANDSEYDSWMSRKILGDSDETTILRLDKNLRWTLLYDDETKKYLECPLGGCSFSNLMEFDKKQNTNDENQFDYAPNDEEAEACSTKITNNSFKVKATGKKRIISGYNSKEYQAKWLVEYKDDKGRKDTNRLNIVFWNTEPTAEMKKVWGMNEALTNAYRKKVKAQHNSLSKLVPDSIFMSLSAFSGGTSKDNKKWQNKVTRELSKVKGYPMSIKVEWYLDRKACIEAKAAPKKEKLDWSNPLAAIKQSTSDMIGKEAEKMFMPNPKEPIFRYVYEVTSIKVEPVHDSVFEIPAGFTLATRE